MYDNTVLYISYKHVSEAHAPVYRICVQLYIQVHASMRDDILIRQPGPIRNLLNSKYSVILNVNLKN